MEPIKTILALADAYKKLPGIGPKTAERLAYATLRMSPEDRELFIQAIQDSMDKVTCTKEYYYEMRSRYNEKLRLGDYDPEMAALFIYLNKHCFNGLYRVNTQGEFNVPWNQKQLVRSMDMENIKRISAFLKSVTLTCQDFEAALEGIQEGDFVYFDSPYAPLNPTSFDSYTKEGFAEEEHRRLAGLFRRLAEKGVYCMLTNHNTELIRELYDGFLIEEIDVRRAINSDPKKRTGKEVIIRSYGEAVKDTEHPA